MSNLRLLFLLILAVTNVHRSKSKEISPEELLREMTESPGIVNDPEHARNMIVSVVEFLSSQSHDMKKLDQENKEMRSKLLNHDRQLKEMLSVTEKLTNENKYLSRKVMKIETENTQLSLQVENLVKQNEGLIDTIALQVNDEAANNNTLPELKNRNWKEPTSSPGSLTNLVQEDTGDKISKRIVLHSDTDVLQLVTTHSAEIQKLQTDIAALKTDKPKGQSGSTYIRWGRNNCSGNGTELVYAGYAAGSDYRDAGAAANYICLSPDPLWGHYNDAHDASAKVMGVEYELYGADHGHETAFFHKNLHEEDAPCSVCRSPRPTVIMIPGRNQCYKGWTLEYKGYLVAGYYGRTAANEYVCLDDNPDVIPGGHTDQNGALFYMVEGRCGSLTCPPYVDGRELTCVVCSK